MIGPLTALNSVFAKSFTVSGRASRAEYWWYVGFYVVGLIAAFSFDTWTVYQAIMAGKALTVYSLNPLDYFTFYWLIINLIPSFSVTIRRLHDAGFSGFFCLLYLVPLIGGLVVFIMLLLPSKRDTNIYGSPPHFPGSGGPRRMTTDASGKSKPHDPMQGYAALFAMKEEPSPEVLAARKAQVRALYQERVLGKPAEA